MVSESQKKAGEKWDRKNWGRRTYISKKGISKSFIKDKATEEDLKELEKLFMLRWEYLAKAEGSKLKIKNSPELLKKVLPDVKQWLCNWFEE